MICLPNRLPFLTVGSLPPAPLHPDQIADQIQAAADAAGRGDFWFAAEIAHGLREYLEEHHNGTTIPWTTILEKLRKLLTDLDCGDVASHLDSSPPPMPLYLDDLAGAAPEGFELLFFQRLREYLDSCRAEGVRRIRLLALRRAVLHLRKARRWSRACASTAEEILAMVRRHVELV